MDMKKLKKLTLKGKIAIFVLVAGLVILLIAIYFMWREPLILKENEVDVEINEEFNAVDNIKEVLRGSIADVKIDDSQVNYQQLGSYQLIYRLDKQEYSITVNVVDTIKPEFDVVNLDLDLGMSVDPANMVANLNDATKTTIKFKEDYDFSHEGTVDVVIVVSDEGNNVTEKKGQVVIVKDDQEPVISKLETLVVIAGDSVDFNQGVTVSDNRDPAPVLTVDSSQVDLNKPGTYYVTYVATDRSGNRATVKREVKVVAKVNLSSNVQSNEKIVYLTFDDGPSANTQKILDILNQYHIKATFFVTGNNQSYNYLIKTAYDQGHTIALHTYSHDYKTVYSSLSAYFNDLKQVSDMVANITGKAPKYVRFPGGSSNTISKKYCPGIMSTLSKELIAQGYQYYDWNVDSSDASGNNVPVSKIIASATSGKANNLNILFHDTAAKSTTVQALPAIIEHYLAQGYRFEGISDSSFAPHQNINN